MLLVEIHCSLYAICNKNKIFVSNQPIMRIMTSKIMTTLKSKSPKIISFQTYFWWRHITLMPQHISIMSPPIVQFEVALRATGRHPPCPGHCRSLGWSHDASLVFFKTDLLLYDFDLTGFILNNRL